MSEESNVIDKNTKPKKKNYRKDKPWDNEDIDHWKVEV